MDFLDRAVVLSGKSGYLVRGLGGQIEERVFHDAGEAIGHALAEGGGSVELGVGDFVLTQPVQIDGPVCISGQGNRTRLLVRCETGMVLARSHGSRLSNLSVIADAPGAKHGVILDDCGDTKLLDLQVSGFVQYGVWMRNKSFLCELRGLSVSGVAGSAIYLEECSEGEFGDYIPTMVTGCIVYGGGRGIELNRAIVVNIVDCVVYQNHGDAYYLHDDSNSVLMSGCRTFQVTGNAVMVECSHELNITGSIFCWHTEGGIVLRDCCWGTITGNNIIDTGSFNTETHNYTQLLADHADAPTYDAIQLLNTRGFVVSANAIFNWGVAPPIKRGVYEDELCAINEIAHNNMNYYRDADVQSLGLGTQVEGNNRFRETAYLANTGILQTFNSDYTKEFIRRVAGHASNAELGGNAHPFERAIPAKDGEWTGAHNETQHYKAGGNLPLPLKRDC